MSELRLKISQTEARERTSQRKQEAQHLETGWISLGRSVRQDLQDGVPQALGVTVTAWMTSTFGSSLARIKRARRIEQALGKVPTKTLKQLPEGNCYELTRLPEKLRTNPAWLGKAEKLPVAEFKEAVEVEREKITGMAREKRTTFWVSLPDGVYDMAKEAESKLAVMMGLEIESDRSLARGQIWEAVMVFLLQTPVEHLKIEIQGGE